jgi:AMP phosphorylase
MSKKIAAGAKYILIDIPYGKGAKVRTLPKAKNLGKKFEKLGKRFNLKMKVVYTDGRQPIGNGLGPVLEMLDIIAILKNKGPQDLKEKSLMLSAELIKLCGIKNAKEKAIEALISGKAYEKFKEIINAQNEEKNFEERVKNLTLAKFKKTIKAKKGGKITMISNESLNSLCRILGTPETIGAGIYLHKHLGKVKKREPLLTFYAESKSKIKDALKFLKQSNPIEIK